MLFMVIERFKNQDPIPVYRRVRDPGIKFPEGLTYVGSWIEPNFDRCFQLMECDDLRLLQQWVLANNRDLGMTFEIVPVVPEQGDARSRRAVPGQEIERAANQSRSACAISAGARSPFSSSAVSASRASAVSFTWAARSGSRSIRA